MGASAVWKGPEAIRNRELMGGENRNFTLEHANRLLTPAGTKKALSPRHIYFQLRAIPILYPGLGFMLIPFQLLEKIAAALRKLG